MNRDLLESKWQTIATVTVSVVKVQASNEHTDSYSGLNKHRLLHGTPFAELLVMWAGLTHSLGAVRVPSSGATWSAVSRTFGTWQRREVFRRRDHVPSSCDSGPV